MNRSTKFLTYAAITMLAAGFITLAVVDLTPGEGGSDGAGVSKAGVAPGGLHAMLLSTVELLSATEAVDSFLQAVDLPLAT